jgi:F-type H+-transporting ATPase subunit a
MLAHLVTLAASSPDQHVYNHPFWKTATGLWVWSGNMGNLFLTAIIMIVGGLWVASKVRTGPESQGSSRFVTTNRFAHAIEYVCVYLREEIARPLLGDRTDKLMPILWTIFFFVLINNLLGLTPIMDLIHVLVPAWREAGITPLGGTATQNLWVTGALALIALIVFNGAALARLGPLGYAKHLTADAPWFVWPIVVPIEFAGQILIKPVALAIRLFANMTGGHILMATLLSFVASVWGKSLLLSVPVSAISIVGYLFIFLLELFIVVPLQAFIFMFLTAVFISLMDHHDEEHGHEHGHDHAHGHEHAHA